MSYGVCKIMDSLSTGLVAQTLQRLFTEAEQADRALMEQYSNAENPDQLAEDFAEHFAEERRDVEIRALRRRVRRELDDLPPPQPTLRRRGSRIWSTSGSATRGKRSSMSAAISIWFCSTEHSAFIFRCSSCLSRI